MEIQNLITHVEALIFASDKPLINTEITELINGAFAVMDDKITQEQIDASIEGIIEKYNAPFYPFEVRESGGGWQFLTKRDFHQTVAQLNGDKFLKRLSTAAMETLAIIAYKQPITKGEIEQIRGVNSDYSVTKLLEKELIIINGRNENMPGRPLLYNTSKTFMDYFGINSPSELPKINEVLADQLIEPTLINHSPANTDEDVTTVTLNNQTVEVNQTTGEILSAQENVNLDTTDVVIEDAVMVGTDKKIDKQDTEPSEDDPIN
jgi:segregation and condensation protein B